MKSEKAALLLSAILVTGREILTEVQMVRGKPDMKNTAYYRLIRCTLGTMQFMERVNMDSLPQAVLTACMAVANNSTDKVTKAEAAAKDWSRRLILPKELSTPSIRDKYSKALSKLIMDNKVKFYEPGSTQGSQFSLDIEQTINGLGAGAYGAGSDFSTESQRFRDSIQPLISQVSQASPQNRDPILDQISTLVQTERNTVTTDKAKKALESFSAQIDGQRGARGTLGSVSISPRAISNICTRLLSS